MHNIERWSSGHWIFFHVTQVLVQHSFPFGAEWINKGGKCAGSVFFFCCFRKDAVFSTKSWSSQECPFYIFSGCQRHPSTCFFPSVLGITQCKQKPIFNINLSFFLIYFLCGKNGFFFWRNESFGYFRWTRKDWQKWAAFYSKHVWKERKKRKKN